MKTVTNFMQNYLPDFIEVWVEWYNTNIVPKGEEPLSKADYDGVLDEEFIECYFRDAVVNFAKKQRTLCHNSVAHLTEINCSGEQIIDAFKRMYILDVKSPLDEKPI